MYLKLGFWAIIVTASLIGCKSYSRYPIDESPVVNIDTSLLGTWKAIEDTDTKNYLVIQSTSDVYPNMSSGHVNREQQNYVYYLTYMGMDGTSPVYGQFKAFTSHVKNVEFLNIDYHYKYIKNGYLIVMIKPNYMRDSIITTIVADSTLNELGSSNALRNKIVKNLANKSFFYDTMHFYKINSYHQSLDKENYFRKYLRQSGVLEDILQDTLSR